MGCFGAVEEDVADWAKVGITVKRRGIENDGVSGFDD